MEGGVHRFHLGVADVCGFEREKRESLGLQD